MLFWICLFYIGWFRFLVARDLVGFVCGWFMGVAGIRCGCILVLITGVFSCRLRCGWLDFPFWMCWLLVDFSLLLRLLVSLVVVCARVL